MWETAFSAAIALAVFLVKWWLDRRGRNQREAEINEADAKILKRQRDNNLHSVDDVDRMFDNWDSGDK